jgi:hypothetical protein
MIASVLKLPLSMLCFRTIFTRLNSVRAAANVKTWFLTMAIATPVYAIDLYDETTGQLTIAQVMVGDTKYSDVIVTIAEVVSGPSGDYPYVEDQFGPRPDTFDLKKQQLIIPAVKVGSTVFTDVVVQIAEVLSLSPLSKVVADAGFNGEIYPNDFKLFVADDLPDEVAQAYREHLQFAADLWGNFGPLEVWIMGSDSDALARQHEQWCQQRLSWGIGFKSTDCEQQRSNNYWPLGDYLDIATQALESGRPMQNACRCGMGQYGFHLMMASAPWGFFKDSPFADWRGDGFDTTPAHEYWHILHFSHLSNKDEAGNRRGGNADPTLGGPGWFIEGSAVYMANIALTKQILSGYVSVHGELRSECFECEMKAQMTRGLEARSQNPGLKLGDFSYEVGRDAIYGLGAWGIAWLYNHVDNDRVLIDSMFPNLQIKGWDASFQDSFGLTPNQFYDEFEKFLDLPYSEQVKILPIDADGKYTE